jgi:outer membrane protein TolC
MLEKKHFCVVAVGVIASGIALAQEPHSSSSPNTLMVPAGELTGGKAAAWETPVGPSRVRRITLEQVKQQHSANRAASPLLRLGQFSIEAAKQHRRGVQADYFPKFGATLVNLHFTEFLGKIFRPIPNMRLGPGPLELFPANAVPLLSQNQTVAVLTFVQPITPLLMVHQAVRVARADERIAMAKAGVAVTRNMRDAEIEETYFKLLIAQRRLTSAELKFKAAGSKPEYAATSIEVVRLPREDAGLAEARKAIVTASANVRELTAALNRIMAWPESTELELVPPDPLVENLTLDEVAEKSIAGNPDLIEAEETVVKARAASAISKLAYVPTVAAVGGYLFQNAMPAVQSNVGYGGVIASYTLFDFGKRESAVKEARAQLGMAEMALQLTKAKIAANLRKSYFELEGSRQLSQVAQKMGSSAALLMKASSNPDSIEVKAARAEMEVEMFEADLSHRQAYARLIAPMGAQR